VDEPLATPGTRDLLTASRVEHELVVDVHLESVAHAHVYVADVCALANQRGSAPGSRASVSDSVLEAMWAV
jgi:hypothetical protein